MGSPSKYAKVDSNPILDEGAPRSIGGIESAVELCDALAIKFYADLSRETYMHEWGIHGGDANPVICTWTLVVCDVDGKPTSISIDLVEGIEPILVGLELKQNADTCNLAESPYIRFKRPTDTYTRTFSIYTAEDRKGNLRLRMEVLPTSEKCISAMLKSTKGDLCCMW